MIRAECAEKRDTVPGMKELGDWLDAHMHEDLHDAYEVDEMLPGVVYSVKIPMTDKDWLNYNQALAHFANARDLHNLLSPGKEELDQVTKVHRNEQLGQLTWPQLTVPEKSLGEMLASLVKQHRLGVPWDWGRMTYHPELVPEELGGSLKNYPLYGRQA